MRTYPVKLRGKITRNVYLFESRTRAIVITPGPSSTRVVGSVHDYLWDPEDTDFWEEVDTELPYDPTQQGDKEDDI